MTTACDHRARWSCRRLDWTVYRLNVTERQRSG